MKKKTIFIAAATLIAGCALWLISICIFSIRRANNPIFYANIEALINGETDLKVDCMYSPEERCTIRVFYQDGTVHTLHLPDAMRVYYAR